MQGFSRRLKQVNSRLTSGEINVEEWANEVDRVLLDGHYTALTMGYERAGKFDYDPAQLKVLARGIKDQESEFLQGFVSHLEGDQYRDESGRLVAGSFDWRTDLYVGRMRGTANEAFTDGSGDDETFDWELGAAEHCGDCIEMAAMSPYTKDTLLSYPGDGSTVCLGNCHCQLIRSDGAVGFPHHTPDSDE